MHVLSSAPIRHIVLLVIDSLRADTASPSPPFIRGRAIEFTQARAAGCWTLPAHAAMFTGRYPHELGCDRRSRRVQESFPTIAELLKDAGWSTHQVTANGVTCIPAWGLVRGFDQIYKTYEHMPPIGWWDKALLVAGVPRLRRMISQGNAIMMESELASSRVWLRSTDDDALFQVRRILHTHRRTKQPSFVYVNLMEAHFPYHIDATFACLSESWIDKLKEIWALKRLVSEEWLHHDHMTIAPSMLALLRARQVTAWQRLRGKIDAFAEEISHRGDTLLIICSDHGDAFGEQGDAYHVQTVSDGCNRVPLWLLGPDTSPGYFHSPVSTTDIFHLIVNQARLRGDQLLDPRLVVGASEVLLQAHYKEGTAPSRRFGSFAFVDRAERYMHNGRHWHHAQVGNLGEDEPQWQAIPGTDPIEATVDGAERRRNLREHFRVFQSFAVI